MCKVGIIDFMSGECGGGREEKKRKKKSWRRKRDIVDVHSIHKE
jgi:hypothetical protein